MTKNSSRQTDMPAVDLPDYSITAMRRRRQGTEHAGILLRAAP